LGVDRLAGVQEQDAVIRAHRRPIEGRDGLQPIGAQLFLRDLVELREAFPLRVGDVEG
jgi:hypothetical protein